MTNQALDKLCLRRNDIGEEGAKAIGRLLSYTTLRELDLFSNNLGDEGARSDDTNDAYCLHQHNGIFFFRVIAAAVTRHSSLVHLDLRGNQIGPAGAQVKPQNTQHPHIPVVSQ